MNALALLPSFPIVGDEYHGVVLAVVDASSFPIADGEDLLVAPACMVG